MNLSERLRTSTKPLHDSAEGHNFQRLLANGLLPIPLYSAYLGQLFLIHQTLETHLRLLADNDARFSRVISPSQYQEQFLKTDLGFLGIDMAALAPLAATAELLRKVAVAQNKNPVSLVGFHYVLLGSKHGGKFIARQLTQKYGFDGQGIKYFDPYGDEFIRHWRGFIDGLNQAQLTESDADDIIENAQATFLGISDIGSALESSEGLR